MNKSAVIIALPESQNKPLNRAHRPQAYSQGSQEEKQYIWKKESPTEVLWTLRLSHFSFSSPLLVWTFKNGKHLYGQILCKSDVQCRRKEKQAAAPRENSRESATGSAQPLHVHYKLHFLSQLQLYLDKKISFLSVRVLQVLNRPRKNIHNLSLAKPAS